MLGSESSDSIEIVSQDGSEEDGSAAVTVAELSGAEFAGEIRKNRESCQKTLEAEIAQLGRLLNQEPNEPTVELTDEEREKFERRCAILQHALEVAQQDQFFREKAEGGPNLLLEEIQRCYREVQAGNPHATRDWICRLMGYTIAFIAITPAAMYPLEVHALPLPLQIASAGGVLGTYAVLAGSFLDDTFNLIAKDPKNAGKVFLQHLFSLGTYARWQHEGQEPWWAKALIGLGFTALDICCLATFFTPYTQAEQMSDHLPGWYVTLAKIFAINAPNTNLRLGHGIVHGFLDRLVVSRKKNDKKDRTRRLINIFRENIYRIAHERPMLFIEYAQKINCEEITSAEKLQAMADLLKAYRASNPVDAGPTLEDRLTAKDSSGKKYALNLFCIFVSLISSIPGALVASNTKPPDILKSLADHFDIPRDKIGPLLGYLAYGGNIPLSIASGLTLANKINEAYHSKGFNDFFANYSSKANWAGAAFGVADIFALIAANVGQLMLNPFPLAGGSLNDEFIVLSSVALTGLGLLTGSAAGQKVANFSNDKRAEKVYARQLSGQPITDIFEQRLVAKYLARKIDGDAEKLTGKIIKVKAGSDVSQFVPPIVDNLPAERATAQAHHVGEKTPLVVDGGSSSVCDDAARVEQGEAAVPVEAKEETQGWCACLASCCGLFGGSGKSKPESTKVAETLNVDDLALMATGRRNPYTPTSLAVKKTQ